MKRRSVPEGIRPTKVGVWFVLQALFVGLAATNTGNNALYMVLSCMLGVLVVSGFISRGNVRRLDAELRLPGETFAGLESTAQLLITNRSRWVPRCLLMVSLSGQEATRVVTVVPAKRQASLAFPLRFEARGWHEITWVHVASLFPFGLFRKGQRQRIDRRVLVYPEARQGASEPSLIWREEGGASSRRIGWGHELHSLRELRPGDDPRRIHWKRSAQLGRLIFTEHLEEGRKRRTIVLDNGVLGTAAESRFERAVSEATGAAIEALAQGQQVELVTRDERVPFGTGSRQRRRVLEALALVEKVEPGEEPLAVERATSRMPQPWSRSA